MQRKVTVDSKIVKNIYIHLYTLFTVWWVNWTVRGRGKLFGGRVTIYDVYEAPLALGVGVVQWKATVDSEIVKNIYIHLYTLFTVWWVNLTMRGEGGGALVETT